MKNSWIERYASYIIAAILGISLGYFTSCIVFYKLPSYTATSTLDKVTYKKPSSNKKKEIKTILVSNIFDLDTGIKATTISEKKAKVVSSINGYRLVGFVSGEDPMALFKKPQKPVVIVTKNRGIDNVWLLDRITKDGVYIKNKKTKEVKKFEFPTLQANLSIFGKKLSVTYSKTYSSSGIEKITVNKSILKKIGNINALFKQVNIVPVFRNGKAFGYRINYIASNSVLRKIGLKRGDIIVSINGEPTTSPNKIMNLYSQVSNMTSVNLDIIRNGSKKTIFVDIK